MKKSDYTYKIITVSIGIAAALAFLVGLYLGSRKDEQSQNKMVSLRVILIKPNR